MQIFRSLFKLAYRTLHSKLVGPCILPFFINKKQSLLPFHSPGFPSLASRGHEEKPAIQPKDSLWFHAASVGELESLYPLILLAAQSGFGITVTILSPSAEGALLKLKAGLEQLHAKILYLGYSPWEGSWRPILKSIFPTVFVSAKYEAWPDLWVSLKELNIPLIIVGARVRRSLKVAKWFSRMMVGETPELILLPASLSDQEPLAELFPHSKIEVTGEPRWDRVFDRIQLGSPRAKELIHKFKAYPRPWGVIGSAWSEDLKLFKPNLSQIQGTLWVVPHKVDSQSIQKITAQLVGWGFSPVLTSEFRDGNEIPVPGTTKACILVDEMGFLTELYSNANWAFIGGGFGAGIHSTIEPAIYGIPLAGGPKGFNRFSEILELQQTGQFSLIHSSEELGHWIQKLEVLEQNGSVWKKEALARLGASNRILEILKEQMRG